MGTVGVGRAASTSGAPRLPARERLEEEERLRRRKKKKKRREGGRDKKSSGPLRGHTLDAVRDCYERNPTAD